MNRVMLLGNLGDDPELRVTSGGQPVMKLSLATSFRWKTESGEQKEKVEWHRLQMWGKRAESLARHLRKGMKIAVEGRISYSSYEDRDGNKRYATDIVIDQLHFCEKKNSGGSSSGDDSGPSPYGGNYGDDGKKADKPAAGAADIDDIPFAPVSDICY